MGVITVLMYFFVGLVIFSHLLFMAMEMFFWEHPKVRKIFAMTEEHAQVCKSLAANVGLYNGFLAAGLIWGLILQSRHILSFFLICIVVAGVVGAITAKRSILYIQGVPAMLALILVNLSFT